MTADCFRHCIKMEYQKITNLIDATSDNVLSFNTKKRIEVYDQSGSTKDRYKPSKQVRLKTSMLRSDLCNCSDAYIVVKGTITVKDPDNNAYDKKVAFENNATFTSQILKNNNTLIANAEYIDIVMHMYNLTKYSKNYSEAAGNLQNYYRDKPNSGTVGNINYSIKDSKYFDYKTNITRRLEGSNTETENVEIIVSLKHLSNFLRTLDTMLTNCEVSLIFAWSENCVLTSKATRDADPDANTAVVAFNNPTSATFKIKYTIL